MAQTTSSFSGSLERFTYFKKDDFEVDWETVSEGKFGFVYKVKFKLWREKCAVKAFTRFSDYRNMVQASKIGRIKFKYLTSIYGLFKDSYVVVMEYMSRGSLDNLLKTHVLMWPKKFQMIHEVTMGMNFLHSMKPRLLHLNLKLSNILLDDHLHVKISDFGVIQWDDSSSKTAFAEHLAARGNISYVPPETFSQNPEPPTSKYDVYSFAIVMWEILTQKRPYCGMNMTEILIRVTSGKRPSVEKVQDDQPHQCEEMSSIMQQCWRQDPSERPAFYEIVRLTEALSDVLKLPDNIPGRKIEKLPHKIETPRSLEALLRGDSKDLPEEPSDKDIVSFLKCKDFGTFKNVLKKEHVSMCFKDNNSLLHYAVATGNTECVRLVLNHGALVNCQSANGYTPLVFAVLKKFHEICGLLVECGADVNIAEQDLWTALHFASQCGDDRAVRLLLDAKAIADVEDKDGWTPLHLASQNGHENVVRHLLSRLSNVDQQEQSGRTALHTACEYGHLRIAKLLLTKGANPNRTDNTQTTALHLAAEQGHFRVARLLVTSGADVKCKNNRSYSALHFAALRGCTGICRLLLNHGENPDVITWQNWMPIHLAALKGHQETLLVLEENGSSLNGRGEGGWTPLHLACHHQNDEAVSVLLNVGTNPNVAEDGGWTPLHMACHKGSFTNVVLLIARHANVNMQNKNKDTPLHLAVQSSSVPIVKALLMNSADKNIVNCKGHTAFDLAQQAKNDEIMHLLTH
ncbi:Ankyrin repeat and protein kinase domain-containing protein 1 [Bagarius yarrelli]|uniref:Ankyrin repeat and protein kinase domain-containing protein 1 n=1 Tax=Bagarius yarrelli TaxID=175774 RepID=A0A556V047_BAGYA|nr:Ankyrin repeat and protein kinase domain-containing protein 1 [Bagarius yarrelli]